MLNSSEEGEDAEHDLMHDLCFPSKKQIAILKGEGYKGLVFNYTDECYSILIFDGRNLKIIGKYIPVVPDYFFANILFLSITNKYICIFIVKYNKNRI